MLEQNPESTYNNETIKSSNQKTQGFKVIISMIIWGIILSCLGGFAVYQIDSNYLKEQPTYVLNKVASTLKQDLNLDKYQYEIAKKQLLERYDSGDNSVGLALKDQFKKDIKITCIVFFLLGFLGAFLYFLLKKLFPYYIYIAIAVASIFLFGLFPKEMVIDYELIAFTEAKDKYSDLNEAILNDDWYSAELLLKNNIYLNDINNNIECDGKFYNLLYISINLEHPEVAKLLINKGADINEKGPNNNASILSIAALKQYLDIVELLISKGADLEAKDIEGKTPVFYSFSESGFARSYYSFPGIRKDINYDIMRKLINEGVEINAVDDFGTSVLMHAIYYDDVVAASTLIDHGCTVRTEDVEYATENDASPAMLDILKGNKKNINENMSEEEIYGNDFLMLDAASRGVVSEVLEWVEKGTDINTQDDNGRTALRLLIINISTEYLKLMLSKGADPKIEDYDGISAIDSVQDDMKFWKEYYKDLSYLELESFFSKQQEQLELMDPSLANYLTELLSTIKTREPKPKEPEFLEYTSRDPAFSFKYPDNFEVTYTGDNSFEMYSEEDQISLEVRIFIPDEHEYEDKIDAILSEDGEILDQKQNGSYYQISWLNTDNQQYEKVLYTGYYFSKIYINYRKDSSEKSEAITNQILDSFQASQE